LVFKVTGTGVCTNIKIFKCLFIFLLQNNFNKIINEDIFKNLTKI